MNCLQHVKYSLGKFIIYNFDVMLNFHKCHLKIVPYFFSHFLSKVVLSQIISIFIETIKNMTFICTSYLLLHRGWIYTTKCKFYHLSHKVWLIQRLLKYIFLINKLNLMDVNTPFCSMSTYDSTVDNKVSNFINERNG